MNIRVWTAGASLAAMSFAAGAATAQENADAAEGDVVIVTGQKIERSLQDTVASVRVVDGEEIADSNIDSVSDIYRRTPNVTGGENNGRFAIRGIDAFSVSGGGNSFLASVYVDGAVLPYRAVIGGPLDVWDVAQVEILRGPQSTLQGRNALAGTVVIRSTDPTWEWDARARVKFEEYGGEDYALAGGGPLVEDQLAFRVAGSTSRSDGFVDNPFLGTNVDFHERDTARGKLLFEPYALPAFRALLTFSYDDHYYGTSLEDAAADYDERTLTFDTPTWESITTKIATLEMDYEVSDALTLTSITSFNDADYAYQYDGDYTAEPIGEIWDIQEAESFTQELRAAFDFGRLNGLVGAYYYDRDEAESYGGRRSLGLGSLGVPVLLTAPPPNGLGLPPEYAQFILSLYAPADPVILDTFTDAPDKVTSYALFTDVSFDVTDRLTVFGGARYDVEEQENAFGSEITVVNVDALPDPANPAFDPTTAQIVAGLNAQLLAMAAAASGEAPPAASEFEAFLPKIGATWRWTPDASTSFTVQRGYRSGGVGSNIARASVFAFDPEYTWNYELAFRSVWLDGALTANANAFYVDWTDQQINVQLSGNSFDSEVRNAGSSHLYGFEAELFYRAMDNLDLFAGIGHTVTEFDEFFTEISGVVTDLSGREFASAPQWTASAGATWRSDGGLFLHADVNYKSDAFAVINPALVDGLDPMEDARTLVNVMVGYEADHFGVYAYANNLFDAEYLIRPDFSDGLVTRGAPQVFGVRLDASL